MGEVSICRSEKGFEEDAIESATTGEAFVARAEELKPERRNGFDFGEERRGEVTVRAGDRHDDERTPAHTEQTLQCGITMRKGIGLVGNAGTEREELANETVERQAGGGCQRKQGGGALCQVRLEILKVVAKLQQHAPVKSESGFRVAQMAMA